MKGVWCLWGVQGLKIEINLDQLKKEIVQDVVAELKPLVMNNGENGDKIFGVKELAKYLGQKPSWVYANIEKIPHTKKGGFLMFKKSCIDEWLKPDYYPVSHGI